MHWVGVYVAPKILLKLDLRDLLWLLLVGTSVAEELLVLRGRRMNPSSWNMLYVSLGEWVRLNVGKTLGEAGEMGKSV